MIKTPYTPPSKSEQISQLAKERTQINFASPWKCSSFMLRMKLVCDILPLMLPPQLLNVLAGDVLGPSVESKHYIWDQLNQKLPKIIVAFRTGATAALRTNLKNWRKRTSSSFAWGKKERVHLLMIRLCQPFATNWLWSVFNKPPELQQV